MALFVIDLGANDSLLIIIIIIVVVVVVVAVIIIIITLIIRFVIKDESGSPILKIEGPLCPCSCCGDVDFSVSKVFQKGKPSI